MKNKIPFLIIGLTGPIGAGCTTLASNIEKITPTAHLRRKKIHEKVLEEMKSISKLMASTTREEELEKLHHEFLESYKEKSYLESILSVNDSKFIYISMSNLIIKKAINCLRKGKYDEWKRNHRKFAKCLEEFYDKWIETLQLFDESEKQFHSLESDQCKMDCQHILAQFFLGH